ncbi:MAG TPA: ATP-binding protein [Candidatus Baltobacteraceae bacterium]|nr:ATP-binding protein [Candidatus Baltobacteraceae bacterium]
MTVTQSETSSSGGVDLDILLRLLDVGILILDQRGHVVKINSAAEALFDIGTRPVSGRSLIEVLPSINLDRRVDEALAGKTSRGPIVWATARSARTLSITTAPFGVEGGAVVLVIDETEKAERERMRLEFVANVSHELRTPLSAIKLMVETLLDMPEEREPREKFLPLIAGEVERVITLVADLLDLARSEGGRLRLRWERIDLAPIVENALRNLQPRAEELRITLASELHPAEMNGDSDRLTQVVFNLVENALKYTLPTGRIDVRVSRDAEAVHLVVQDTGEGIPFLDLPHVFERFYVVERSRAREAAGTGLGLAIVKHVVKAHGGSVSAQSELGVGSVFTCTFPNVDSDVDPLSSAVPKDMHTDDAARPEFETQRNEFCISDKKRKELSKALSVSCGLLPSARALATCRVPVLGLRT